MRTLLASLLLVTIVVGAGHGQQPRSEGRKAVLFEVVLVGNLERSTGVNSTGWVLKTADRKSVDLVVAGLEHDVVAPSLEGEVVRITGKQGGAGGRVTVEKIEFVRGSDFKRGPTLP